MHRSGSGVYRSSFIVHRFCDLLLRAAIAEEVIRKVLVRRNLGPAADAVVFARPFGELSRRLLVVHGGGGQSFCTPLYDQPFDVAASCSGFFSSPVLKRY